MADTIVVRELINRISFQVDNAEKKKVTNLMKNIDKAGLSTVHGVKGLLKGVTAAALAALTAGGAITVKYEKAISRANFFSTSVIEADKLKAALNKIAKETDSISDLEAAQAAGILSQMRLTSKQIGEFLPFLRNVSIARRDLDFTDVAENFREVISGGNLDKLIELIPGFKTTVELLSKTKFKAPFGDLTDVQRAKVVLQAYKDSAGALDELAKAQKETLDLQLEETSAAFSNLGKHFGDGLKPGMIEVLKLVEDTMKTLKEADFVGKVTKASSDMMSESATIIRNAARKVRDFDYGGALKELREGSAAGKKVHIGTSTKGPGGNFIGRTGKMTTLTKPFVKFYKAEAKELKRQKEIITPSDETVRKTGRGLAFAGSIPQIIEMRYSGEIALVGQGVDKVVLTADQIREALSDTEVSKGVMSVLGDYLEGIVDKNNLPSILW